MSIDRPQDKRKFGRRPVYKAAVIALADDQRLPGALLDLSEGGAKIKLAQPERLIGEFYLEVPGDDLIVKCRLVRVDGEIAGLQYVKAPRRLSWLKR